MHRPISNPPNPWESRHVEWLGEPPRARLVVYEERARSIVAENASPDVPFSKSLNPYRGCQHACAYCYARPSHQLLGLGAGTDFDTRIVVKTNAAELLRSELARARWRGRETLVFSGVTDCYQPLEASYGLTRACLEVALEFRQPVAVITKGALVRRDLDLLARLARGPGARVFVSIAFADAAMCRRMEPGTAAPATRFETLAALSAAGVPCGVSLAPLIPGLNEDAIPAILAGARAAGASEAFLTLLRLPAEVEPVFVERLQAAFPERAARVLSALEEARGGKRNESAFFRRMQGQGPRYRAARELFLLQARRLGIAVGPGAEPLARSGASPAPKARQGDLFAG
jgi:DNA repair photolyase